MIDSHEEDVEIFADGNMSRVVRRGSSVYREAGPWADAALQVLRHLESGGFSLAPRLLNVMGTDIELEFIAGVSMPADLAGYEDEALLVQVGEMTRSLHGAMSGFVPAPGTSFVAMDLAPDLPTLICHNDIAPWNTIVDGDRVTGIIDWDLVAPGTPAWELAYAAWRFAPIYPEGRIGFSPAGQARRIRLLLDAYRLERASRVGFVETVLRRQRSAVTTVERLGRAGVPGFVRLYEDGLHLSGVDDREWLERHRAEFVRIVEDGGH